MDPMGKDLYTYHKDSDFNGVIPTPNLRSWTTLRHRRLGWLVGKAVDLQNTGSLRQTTLPKFNMEPKNDGFQDRNLLFQGAIFRFYVKFGG